MAAKKNTEKPKKPYVHEGPITQLWQLGGPVGRPRTIATAEELEEKCVEYFKWCDANPLQEQKLVSFQGVSTRENVNKLRAYTIGGLHLYLGVSDTTWGRYRDGTMGDTYREICRWAEKCIYQQKFAGAAADLLNPVIIARDLGLKDTVQQEVTSPDGSMSPSKELSDEELKKELERRGLPANLLQE